MNAVFCLFHCFCHVAFALYKIIYLYISLDVHSNLNMSVLIILGPGEWLLLEFSRLEGYYIHTSIYEVCNGKREYF